MPCNDITDTLETFWDHNDALHAYRFNKRTCGADVGHEMLLQVLFQNKNLTTIAAMQSDVIQHLPMQDAEEFLYYKHFFAMQALANTLLGLEEAVTLVSVGYDGEGMHVIADIAAAPLERKIKSCGRCGSCGKKKASLAVLQI